MATKDFITPDRRGLVAEYLLNGNSKDTSGNGYDGSASGVLFPKTDRGYQTYCGQFDGSTSYVTAGDVLDFEYDQTLSIVCVAKINNTGEANIVSKQQNSGSYIGWGFGTSSVGKPRFFIYAGGEFGGSIIVDYPNVMNDGKFHHYGMTYDGSNSASGVKLYLDSQEVTGTVIGNFPVIGSLVTSADFQVSGRGGASNLFNGLIQSVRIFNRALSQTEIRNWYLEGLRQLGGGSLYPLLDGLVAYYDFRGDASDIVGALDGYSITASLANGRFGESNGGYVFPGNTQIPIPTALSNVFTGNNSASVFMWAKPSGSYLASNFYCGTNNDFTRSSFYIDSTGIGFAKNMTTGEQSIHSNASLDGIITFGGFTFDGTTKDVKIYKDGELATTGTFTGDGKSLHSASIGRYNNGGTFYDTSYGGTQYEILVFDRVKEPWTVKALYELSVKSKLLPIE